MKEYLISAKCVDLAIIMIGGLKPEYYIREKVFYFLIFKIFDQVLNGKKIPNKCPQLHASNSFVV